jgi:tRNA U55 pseudouridine synthase TruB
MLKKITTNDAARVWQFLNGIINVYKPAGVSVRQVRSTIISNLCRDLNQLKVREPRDLVRIEGIQADDETKYIVKREPNYADNLLVVGERYQNEDVRCGVTTPLGIFSSGVMILGINGGTKYCPKLRENKSIKVYHVIGRLGMSTESHFSDSPATSRATCHHVFANQFDGILASIQASHQKKMFDMCSVDIQSQAAYELAVKGPIRPTTSNIPLIYGIRLIDFKRPYFTLEIHSVNESEAYLGILIHELGLTLKTVAHCTQIRCIRNSHFTVENSLVRQQWNLQSIVSNMSFCNRILKKHPEILRQESAQLVSLEQ